MNALLKTALSVSALTLATHASAQITFYENDNFSGRSFTASRQVNNFERAGFNDRASSVVVMSDRWEVCEDEQFGGRCIVLRPGRYSSLSAMGLNDRVSSVRSVSRGARIDDTRFAPVAEPVYDNRRRNNERLFEADVTSVRAVVGRAEQRCWIEREQVGQSGNTNVPGAILGAVIGGVLGHQIGGGRGQDIATAGGAVAGAAYGSGVGGGGGGYTQNVQRCSDVSNSGPPTYWDVTYNFRGQEHRVQTSYPPGRTITVNRQGEPRA
jgi:uncharacterized protein YcfJ